MNPQEAKPVESKTPRHRSPNYPAMSLKRAIDKIIVWYKADGLVASPRDAAMAHMGFEKFTGDAGRLLSTLKSYGLVQEAEGRLKLTQRGIDIVARPDDDPKRLVALKEAALAPAIYRDLFKEYGVNLPSDATLKAELIASKGFNPKAVDEFIKDFRTTLKNGGVSDSQVLESKEKDLEDEGSQFKVGDFVQWESQGVLQFQEPRRIREISDDGAWAFVEGSNTGVPMSQLSVVEQPKVNPPAGEPPKPRTVVEEIKRTPVGSEIPVAADCVMGVTASGKVTQGGIDKLISYLQLIKSSFPQGEGA